jgi:hypothetical protein
MYVVSRQAAGWFRASPYPCLLKCTVATAGVVVVVGVARVPLVLEHAATVSATIAVRAQNIPARLDVI